MKRLVGKKQSNKIVPISGEGSMTDLDPKARNTENSESGKNINLQMDPSLKASQHHGEFHEVSLEDLPDDMSKLMDKFANMDGVGKRNSKRRNAKATSKEDNKKNKNNNRAESAGTIMRNGAAVEKKGQAVEVE